MSGFFSKNVQEVPKFQTFCMSGWDVIYFQVTYTTKQIQTCTQMHPNAHKYEHKQFFYICHDNCLDPNLLAKNVRYESLCHLQQKYVTTGK